MSSAAVGHGWHAGQGFSVDLELEQDDLDLVLQASVGGHLVDHVVGTFLKSEHGIPAIASIYKGYASSYSCHIFFTNQRQFSCLDKISHSHPSKKIRILK